MTQDAAPGRGGKRAGSGRRVVWTRQLQVWLLMEYYTLIADGYTSDEALQVVAYRLKKEHDAKLAKTRLPEARKAVRVGDLPDFLRRDVRRRHEPDAPEFTTIEEWARCMRELGKANRPRQLALRARIARLKKVGDWD